MESLGEIGLEVERELMPDVQRREGLYGFEFLEPDLRRVDPAERKTYNAKQMWQRSHEVCNLSAQGWKNVDIAKIMNLTPETVSNIVNSDLGKLKISQLRGLRDEEAKKVNERIRIMTDKALNVYDDILDADPESLSLKDKGIFAKSFLDSMSGLRVPVRLENLNLNATLSAEKIELIKNRGKEAMKEAGLASD